MRKDTFLICKDCYYKLHLLGIELETLTSPLLGDKCWMCDREFDEKDLNWCVRPQRMRKDDYDG
jgi:hypothetical protein